MTDESAFFDQAEDMVEADVSELMGMLREATNLESRIEVVRAELQDLNSRLNELKSKDLPNLMAEQGVSEIKDAETGYKVSLDHAVNASLPKNEERRNEILESLKPLGVDEIVQDKLEFAFPKGSNQPAMVAEFADRYKIPFLQSRGVHASTFKKWLKERIAEGKGAEITEAGIWHGRVAELTKPRR